MNKEEYKRKLIESYSAIDPNSMLPGNIADYFLFPDEETRQTPGRPKYMGAKWGNYDNSVEGDLVKFNCSLYAHKFNDLTAVELYEILTLPRQILLSFNRDNYLEKCKKFLVNASIKK